MAGAFPIFPAEYHLREEAGGYQPSVSSLDGCKSAFRCIPRPGIFESFAVGDGAETEVDEESDHGKWVIWRYQQVIINEESI